MHQFWSVYLLVNKMALIFLGVPIVFFVFEVSIFSKSHCLDFITNDE